MNSKRIEFIDLAKGIAILLVIIGHCYWVKEFPIVKKVIYSFHMPLFFIISGFFSKKLPLIESIVKHSKAYLLPLVVTSLIALALIVVGDIFRCESVLNSINSWIKIMFTMRGNQDALVVPMITPLWFLMALFYGSTIYSQLLRIDKSSQCFFSVCGLCLVSALNASSIHLPLMIEEGVLSVLFLWIGRCLRDLEFIQLRPISKLGYLSLLLIWVVSIHYGPFHFKTISFGHLYITLFGAIAGSMIILKLCYCIKGKIRGGWLGRNTLNVLCGHVISFNVLKAVGFRWEDIILPNFAMIFVETIVMILMAIVIAKCLSYIRPYKNG